MRSRDIRAQRAAKAACREFALQEMMSEQDDEILDGDMPEMAAWDWPMPVSNQPKEMQS